MIRPSLDLPVPLVSGHGQTGGGNIAPTSFDIVDMLAYVLASPQFSSAWLSCGELIAMPQDPALTFRKGGIPGFFGQADMLQPASQDTMPQQTCAGPFSDGQAPGASRASVLSLAAERER
jgi:hypothetical protein